MTAFHQPIDDPTLQASAYRRLAPTVFAVTLFLSALLLFAVQPMFTKMVLPRLGGAPTVWSVAMVFFQAALLAGYAYAHLLIRFLPLGVGALVHLIVLAVAAMTLPIGIAAGFESPPTNDVAIWLIGLLSVSIGLPFAVLSASAPLLQGWFAASGHPHAGNPYVLYSASNLGSLVALLAYPVVIEPLLPLAQQSRLWSVGFVGLAVLIAMSGLFVAGRPSLVSVDTSTPVSARDRLVWMALAAIPAGLVIAVTSHITTDIAAAPFLWVVPLALYLMTFIGVFRDRPWIRHETVITLVPFVVMPLALFLLSRNNFAWILAVAVNLIAFFMLSLLCHGEVYRRRPEPARLTEFYLFVSLGGVIGGIFAALIAPHLFSHVYEYPILIVASLFVLPGVWSIGPRRVLIEAGPALAVAATAIVVRYGFDVRLTDVAAWPLQVALVVLATLMLLQRRQAVRLISLVVLAFVLTAMWQPGLRNIETVRSFFGVHHVVETANGSHRILLHGTTIHGAQRVQGDDAGARPEPLTYYYFGGPISQTIEAVRTAKGRLGQVAVVGLGSGSLACHSRARETWTFYEIDPEVVRIAKNPGLFTFLSTCAPNAGIVLGDARLTLAKARQRHDLIIVDAFSSDAIPVHLMTREAIAGYRSLLNDSGVLVMHISNRHMELGRVVAAVGAAEGFVTYSRQDNFRDGTPSSYKLPTIVTALARKPAHLGRLMKQPGWAELKPDPRVAAWTDDYSDIVGAIYRKKFGHQ